MTSYKLSRTLSSSNAKIAGMSPVDFVGVPEIAEQLEVDRRTAWRYVSRDDFPNPEAQVSGKRLWKRSAVEQWAKKNLPLKFDPRSKRTT
jgi:predicted DNA-binding transcriptional regulator AlpA